MTKKIRALIIGGDERRNIPKGLHELVEYTHVAWDKVKIPPQTCPEAEVIIVITRWVADQAWKCAQDFSKKRKIPLIQARTGNYIVSGLRQHRQFRGRLEQLESELKKTSDIMPAGEATADVQPEAVDACPGSDPVTAGFESLSNDELETVYGAAIIKEAKNLMGPGARYDKKDLIPVLAVGIGVPEFIVEKLMPYLIFKGVLDNPSTNIWERRVAGTNYTFKLDVKPDEDSGKQAAASKIDKPAKDEKSKLQKLVDLVPGLPAGPYASGWAVVREMTKYKEFVNSQGGIISRTYAGTVRDKAVELGSIVEDGGKFTVKHSDGVKLTMSDQALADAERTAHKLKEKEKAKPVVHAAASNPAVCEIPKPVPPAVEEPKITSHYQPLYAALGTAVEPKAAAKEPERLGQVPELKKLVGEIASPDILPGTLKLLRSMIPQQHWNACAQLSILDRFKTKGVPMRAVPRELFTNEEWDALVWETLKTRTFAQVAPQMRELYEDEKVLCKECGTEFVFSKGEKQFYFDKFGEVYPPATCKPCRKQLRDGGREEDRFMPSRWQ